MSTTSTATIRPRTPFALPQSAHNNANNVLSNAIVNQRRSLAECYFFIQLTPIRSVLPGSAAIPHERASLRGESRNLPFVVWPDRRPRRWWPPLCHDWHHSLSALRSSPSSANAFSKNTKLLHRPDHGHPIVCQLAQNTSERQKMTETRDGNEIETENTLQVTLT